MMGMPLTITASYAFREIPEAALPELRRELMTFGSDRKMQGLVLIATEGINSTVSGSKEAIAEWKAMLTERFGEMVFKDSSAEGKVFRRWSVKIKPEIVGLKDNSVHPSGEHRHLTPEAWHAMLQEDDILVIDARNSYEYDIGKFENAIDPGTRAFHEFPEAIGKMDIPKDKKVMMYCTGGIRCEKAIYAMEKQGYKNVFQLEGGILAYLEKFPEGKFDGECFVFDHRVAVDGHLRPSKTYQLCPHCGNPGDQPISCLRCKKEQNICTSCIKEESRKTCSKNCYNKISVMTANGRA